jgi:hypothetical protein
MGRMDQQRVRAPGGAPLEKITYRGDPPRLKGPPLRRYDSVIEITALPHITKLSLAAIAALLDLMLLCFCRNPFSKAIRFSLTGQLTPGPHN